MTARNIASNEKSDNTFIRLIGLIICIGAAASVAVVILFMLKMGFTITSGYILLFVLVDIALVALAFYLFLSHKVNRNNVLRFGSFALVGLMLFINLFMSSYLSATDDFLGGSFGTTLSGGVVEYSIVAQRTAGIQLSAKTEVRAGIQSTDTNKSDAETETQKLTAASFQEFSDMSSMIGATEDNDVDIAVVQNTMLDAFAEYFPDSYNNLDVLATFKAGTDATQSQVADTKVDISKPFSIYVSGLDVEGDINQPGRSDSNMLILVDPSRYKMMLISTPRDYYVQLHGTTGIPDKLTHAGMYGIDMCQSTMEDIYGIKIDYHIQINFTTISTFVQSMGGILVDNPQTFTLWGQTYKQGTIWLNGDQALLFSRARKSLAEGDIDRGKNQQLVIEGMINRMTSPNIVVKYKELINNMSGTFVSNIPPNVITQLFSRQISLGGKWDIQKMNATGTNAQRPTYSMGAQLLDVVIPDEQSVYDISMAIDNFMNGR